MSTKSLEPVHRGSFTRRLAYWGLRAFLVAAAALAGIAPAGAGAATTVGTTFVPSGFLCQDSLLAFQTVSPSGEYVVPNAGVLTSWSHRASNAPPSGLKLEVARESETPNQFLIVGNSAVESPPANVTTTYTDISIPVQAGDILGLRSNGTNKDCGELAAGFDVGYKGSVDPAPGETVSAPFTSALRLDVSATLEPDCDADGLGDETEDPDLSSCSPLQPPAPAKTPEPVGASGATATAPDTSLKSAEIVEHKATFRFGSSGAGSTFLCRLDRKAFASCRSPKTYRNLKPGRHEFQVKARDAQGNLDQSPVVKKFKIK